MSYEPTNWKDGDLVTSAKLNKIEQGIAAGGGVLIAHDEDGTLDKTWQEISEADACIISRWINRFPSSGKGFYYVKSVLIAISSKSTSDSQLYTVQTDEDVEYIASSPDDYPVLQESDESSDTPITK